MKRETTNRIRFVLEDLLPPILRDSAAFHWFARRVWGDHITRLAEFRERSAMLTPKEYETLYREHPRVHDGTDNSQGCIDAINHEIVGENICDVGCGTGHLLRVIKAHHGDHLNLTGVDFVIEDVIDPEAKGDGVEYVAAAVEDLPYPDNHFDTVICTHVIEHVIEPRKAIAELRRVAKKRLIIVVPKEREYKYTFNPHFNFFPYVGSFLRVMYPVPKTFDCHLIGRDIFYCEDVSDS